MAKKQASAAAPPQRARKSGAPLQATRAQRAFVVAAAGLGVPRKVICQMLPGARSGETAAMTSDMLRHLFPRELRDGLKLAVALVEARVFQRALTHDDRSALTAQLAILNTRGGWKTAGEPAAVAEPSGQALAIEDLNREERQLLRSLLAKATRRADAES
jgi:hypothetical protein